MSDWAPRANCLGVRTSLFFTSADDEVELARGVCRGCVVREPCRAYADVQGVRAGVWGGSDIEGDRASGAAAIANLLHPSNLGSAVPAAPGRG